MELQFSAQNLEAKETQYLEGFLKKKLKHLEHFFGEPRNHEGMVVKARVEYLPHRHTYSLHLSTHLKTRDVEYKSEGQRLELLLRESWRRFERAIVEEWKSLRKRWSIARKHAPQKGELLFRSALAGEIKGSPEEVRAQLRSALSEVWEELKEYAGHEIRLREYLGELPRGHLRPEEVVDEAVLKLLEEVQRGGEPPEDLRLYLVKWLRIRIAEEIIRQGQERSLPWGEEEGEEFLEEPELLPEPLQREVEKHPQWEKPYLEIFSALPPRDRALVRLYMEGDRTLKDLARIYGVTLEEVQKKVEEVKGKLEAVQKQHPVVSSS